MVKNVEELYFADMNASSFVITALNVCLVPKSVLLDVIIPNAAKVVENP